MPTETKRPLVYLVAGARPNFVKLAPVLAALKARGILDARVIHTGQHYDAALSESFFEILQIDAPDVNLDVGSGTHAVQTGLILARFEELLMVQRPEAIVVFGDVNSTLACSLAGTKLHVPVAHVEAGLRSFDRSMPEEINRLVTDALAGLLLVSEPSGVRNLISEGRPQSMIRQVGNVMIDSLRAVESRLAALAPWSRFGFTPRQYGFVTVHRPANVDDPRVLRRLLDCLQQIAREVPLVFAVHPRTAARLQALDFSPSSGLVLSQPLNYLDSIGMQAHAALVLTDSGGIQEETTCLDIPCLTLRSNTERPVTVELGSNTLVGNDPARIFAAYEEVRAGTYKKAAPIPLWDGQAAFRVADAVTSWLAGE